MTMNINATVDFGTAGATATEISSEDVRVLLRQIEAELHRSEVYRIALQSLKKTLGEGTNQAEIVVRAVGREAIQLSIKQLIRRHRMMVRTAAAQSAIAPNSTPEPEAVSPTPPPPPPPSVVDVGAVPEAPGEEVETEETGGKSEISPQSEAAAETASPTSEPIRAKKKKRKKLTPAERTQQAKQQREDCLRQLGKTLQKAREACSLSLRQLHYQTLVPVSLVQALETGCLDRLPEDIYLRGFICRLGNALGLDGPTLAASLPTPSPDGYPTPSWSKVKLDSGFYLNSVHLYLGYTAILAGSLSGFAWLAQQPLPESDLPPDVPEATPDTKSEMEIEAVPGLKSDRTRGIVLGADIAPPERMAPELMPQQLTSMGAGNFVPNPG